MVISVFVPDSEIKRTMESLGFDVYSINSKQALPSPAEPDKIVDENVQVINHPKTGKPILMTEAFERIYHYRNADTTYSKMDVITALDAIV